MFRFHSNLLGTDEIKDLSILTDFQTWKHGVVAPVQYYNSIYSISW